MEYEELKRWAAEPTQIPQSTIGAFLRVVHHGLMNEAHHRPFHKLHYINWAMNTIATNLAAISTVLKPPANS